MNRRKIPKTAKHNVDVKSNPDALLLVRRPLLHPDLAKAMLDVGARVYELVPPESLSESSLSILYPTFFHALCGQEFCISVYHIFWFKKPESLPDLIERLRRIEPSVQFNRVELPRSKPRGLLERLFEQERPCLELLMRTRSLEALQLLFAEGDMYFIFEDWLLDRPGARFPLETFRQGETESAGSMVMRWKAMVEGHVGYLVIQELHGPVLATLQIDEDTVLSAAERVAAALGLPLAVE